MPKLTQPDSTVTLRQRRGRDTTHAIKDGLELNSRVQFIQTGDMILDGAAGQAIWPVSTGVGFFTVVTLPKNQDATAFFQAYAMPSWGKGTVGLSLGIAFDTLPIAGDQIVMNVVGNQMLDVSFADLKSATTLKAATRAEPGIWQQMWNSEFTANLIDSGFTQPNEIYLTDFIMSIEPTNHYSSIIQVGVQRKVQLSQDTYTGIVGLSCALFAHFPEYE